MSTLPALFAAAVRGCRRGLAIVENLIINLEQIEAPREPFHRQLSQAFLAEVLKDAPAYAPRGPAELNVHVTKLAGGDALLEGAMTVGVASDCRRCLRTVSSDAPIVFTLNMVHRSGARAVAEDADEDSEDEEGATFDETMPDEELFDGERIDLGPIAREQILLGMPAIEPLCSETCKGLCTTCGQDLNERDCGHSQKIADPRWSALKGIKV